MDQNTATLSPADAPPGFTAYEAIRHRLPAPARKGACRRARHLGDIADRYDTILLDAYGVLNRGMEPVAGVPERICALQASGKRIMVVSNAAGFAHRTLMQRYGRLGYDFDAEDVITSRKTLVRQLEQEGLRHWGMIAGQHFGPDEFPPLDYRMLADDIADYDAVEGFLLVGASEWTPARQALLIESLKRRPRPLFVANPDLLAPQEGGYSTEPGTYAHEIQDETGVEPVFYGKPYGNIFELAMERLQQDAGIDPGRVLMVGDTLHTDVLGGQTAGLHTALVTRSGVLADMDIDAAIAASGIAPDWILDQA
ncbi:HAD-IIA family hydrolase [Spiribacter insolitus]|uniref:HAD-IIA family hydrolase n=1 Tax=Spiribacter insolitus TaxID=3122417 RepID=A0ABV3T4Z7_9GAMM